MTPFKDLPIRRKLLVAFLGTATAALLLACASFIIYERATFRDSMVRNLTVLADALGKNCTAALSFVNQADAEETLRALSFEPVVVSGSVYTSSGEFFAGYAGKPEFAQFPEMPGKDGAQYQADHLVLFRPVMLNGKRVGTIFLKASLEGVNERTLSYIGISGIVLLGALVLTYAISAGFERVISQPILSLSNAANWITEKKDYSVRVVAETNDELGVLSQSFNQMLDDIQQRDSTLKQTNVELQQQVDARVEAEQQLTTLNEQLEARVADRTKELQRSNEELEQFAYVASHDLQEPLRMVTGYVQLLERRYKGKLDPDADQFINFAVDGAKRMQSLIQDLLSYSRVGTRGKPLVPTDTEELLTEVLTNLEVASTESKATITHDHLPKVLADPTQFSQLLQNLIANALKFRGAEPPNIHVQAKKKGRHYTFSVHDNGIGIDPQFYERIFIIFQRLHSREEYAGTGIGLAVCRKIVERHGGSIWVQSEPGKGTTFFFTIPATLETKPKP